MSVSLLLFFHFFCTAHSSSAVLLYAIFMVPIVVQLNCIYMVSTSFTRVRQKKKKNTNDREDMNIFIHVLVHIHE